MKNALIAAAILLCQPSLPRVQVARYAEATARAAARNRVPPVLLVAVAENESRWHRSAVSANGEYVGLGMVRLRNYAACRDDLATPACQAVKAMLLDGASNLAVMAKVLRLNIDHCRRKGHPGLAVGLAGYQGNGCKPTRLTRKVLARWKALERQASRARRRQR